VIAELAHYALVLAFVLSVLQAILPLWVRARTISL